MKNSVILDEYILKRINSLEMKDRERIFQVRKVGCCANCVYGEWNDGDHMCLYRLTMSSGMICDLYCNPKNINKL